MERRNMLLEIGTEELPTTYIQPALDQLRTWGERWALASSITVWGTPRRLVLFIKDLPQFKTETVFGPPLQRAKDENGNWNKSAIGFARSRDKTVDDLQAGIKNGKKYLKLEVRLNSQRGLRDELIILLNSIKFPKTMRWIPDSAFRFARPIRWLVFMWGEHVTDLQVAGVRADRYARGHRFFGDKPVKLSSADISDYQRILRREYVIVDPTERRKKLVAGLLKQQEKYRPGIRETDLDVELVDEVGNLVEYPRVISGSFDESFLNIPSPVLITVMKTHQRYFPVRDGRGRLLPKFLVVANGPFKKTKSIRENNERVLRSRLADAEFFWEEDLLRSLEERVPDLEGVIFHARLGTYLDKVRRLEKLATFIAGRLGLSEEQVKNVKRAVLLCKSDLTTAMVTEFTELQGTMGMEYARKQGEAEDVARAIFEHYLPRSAEDVLPKTAVGQVLSLADKLDTVVAFLGAGITPSGSQDPYGLRRQAQGVIRLVAEKQLSLRFNVLVEKAVTGLKQERSSHKDAARQVLDFFRNRLEAFLETRNVPPDVVQAVLAAGWFDLPDVMKRVRMLQDLAGTTELMAATTIVERTFNIVHPEKLTGREKVRQDLLKEPAEKRLFSALETSTSIRKVIEEKKYREATKMYARAFSGLLSAFFEDVMVNVEEKSLRKNRMVLLSLINRLYSERVANLALLQFKRGEHMV